MTRNIALLAASTLALAACGTTDRLSQIGQYPDMSPIDNPSKVAGPRPVIMPMPQEREAAYAPNSLWQAGSRTFFNDQRADEIGDILTVNINITDSARVSNSTDRQRTSSNTAGAPNFFGLETLLDDFLPDGVDPSTLASTNSVSSNGGSGDIDRSEAVELTVAAVVTQILPNGNLVIAGRQEVRINYEVRELLVSGIARPEDITSDNTIKHTQIAEARISYGGRGHLSEVQKPRYGQELYEVLFPF